MLKENDAAWERRLLEQTRAARNEEQATYEDHMAELKALHHEVTGDLLKDLEEQRTKTKQAEGRLKEFKRECSIKGAVVYPLLEMYEQVSLLTDLVLEEDAKNAEPGEILQ
jgi:hypothetical protein